MSDHPDPNAESLPAWARESLDAAFAKPEAAPSALAHRDAAAWTLLVEAAVVGTFLPKELAPDAVRGEERPKAENVILGFAEMAYGPDGVKWSLTQQTRAEVLEAAQRTGELFDAISRTAARFVDPISRALRECLKAGSPGEPPAADPTMAFPASSDLESLEAFRGAAALLSKVSFSKMGLAALGELDRRIEFRRLLAQFERMVGQVAGESRQATTHHFFGRADEMELLRDYVGVIKAETWVGAAKRALKGVSRAVRGRQPMSVWGIGGAGKTTLISKFMLEHAEAADSRFPFAYLDFDRSTVSARRWAGLLAEMCTQVGTQFEELSKPMAELGAELSRQSLKLDASRELESMSGIARHALKFRHLIDDHLDSLESAFEWARPFLLVFDTFEVVQYTQDDVLGLEEFMRAFSHGSESGMWPRLRLILSGRNKVASFLGPVEELALGALDPKGSVELLMALARDAGKPIAQADADRLVAAVASATKESNKGVQPLRLQLIGEVFKDDKARGDGRSIARELEQELRLPLKSGGLAAKVLIDGVLIRRVLGHVRDLRVQALADPGLVVRRITPDVIENVMTRGSYKPGGKQPADLDAEPVEPWEVYADEARSIFDAVRREVSLVEYDGRALRHRPDIRRQMLPLIRAHRPNRFRALNQLAFEYFRDLAESDAGDLAAAAEAVYHGLWVDVPLEKIERLWRESPSFDPRIGPDEFEPESAANIFLRAKARASLKPAEVAQLPREVALKWLDGRAAGLLESRRIEGAIDTIRAAAGSDYEALDDRVETAAVLARLLFRAGLWDDAVRLVVRHLNSKGLKELGEPDKGKGRSQREGGDPRRVALLSLARTWATIGGKSGGETKLLREIYFALTRHVTDQLALIDIGAYVALGMAQSAGSVRRQDLLISTLTEAARYVRQDQWGRAPRILRLAILIAGPEPDLIAKWVDYREWMPHDVGLSFLAQVCSQIFRGTPAEKKVRQVVQSIHSSDSAKAINDLDVIWRQEKPEVLKALRTRKQLAAQLWLLVASDHSDWTWPLGNALTRALKQQAGGELAAWLDKSGFRAGKGAQRRGDGVAIVQTAADDGRLLDLARELGRQEQTLSRQAGTQRQSEYSQDVFSLARALLRWHGTIFEIFKPNSLPER